MRYLLLLAGPEERWNGVALPGAELLGAVSTATTVRKVNGRVVIEDGPFASTEEVIGAFAVLEAPDLDAALSVVRSSRFLEDACVEIRPVAEPANG